LRGSLCFRCNSAAMIPEYVSEARRLSSARSQMPIFVHYDHNGNRPRFRG
jgi:hypothetical protein